MNQKSKWLLRLLIISLTGFALYFLGLIDGVKNFLTPENLKDFIESFGFFAPLIFIALYYGLILAFVSATAFTIISGLLFGPVWGSLYVIFAATIAAQTAFFITRQLPPKKLNWIQTQKGIGPLLKKVEEKSQKNGFKSIFLLRCLLAPYIPLSYAAGMIQNLRARDFFFATLLTNIIFTPAFVFLGDSLLQGPKALLLPIIMVLLVLAIPRILPYFKSQKHV